MSECIETVSIIYVWGVSEKIVYAKIFIVWIWMVIEKLQRQSAYSNIFVVSSVL